MHKKIEKYYCIQKLVGLAFAGGSLIVACLIGGDVTPLLVSVPLGVWLMFTKEMVLQTELYWEIREEAEKRGKKL